MKRAKLIFKKTESSIFLGRQMAIVDADTGEELMCCSDIKLMAPVKGEMRAVVDLLVSEIEVEVEKK